MDGWGYHHDLLDTSARSVKSTWATHPVIEPGHGGWPAVTGASSAGSQVHLTVQSSGRAQGCRPRTGLDGEGATWDTIDCTIWS